MAPFSWPPLVTPFLMLIMTMATQIIGSPLPVPDDSILDLEAVTNATAHDTVTAPLTTAGPGSTQLPPSQLSATHSPDTQGTIVSTLEASGRPSVIPFPVPVIHQNSSFQGKLRDSVESATLSHAQGPSKVEERVTHTVKMKERAATDCFAPMATPSIPSEIPARSDHPVSRNGIMQNGPISTNKFYGNLFLGDQSNAIWTHPYSVAWSKGRGPLGSWGMAISHIDANQRSYGPNQNAIPGKPVQYFINPTGIQSILLSAVELGSSTVLTTRSLQAFSVDAVLSPQAGSASNIMFPLVQGMGFVTALYNNLMPTVQSGVSFAKLMGPTQASPGVYRYLANLADEKYWFIYAISSNYQDPQLQLVSNTQIQGKRGWSGTIQVAKAPSLTQISTYDSCAGVFATSVNVTGSTSGSSGTYQFQWHHTHKTRNQQANLLMFALPHHVTSFGPSMKGSLMTSLQLQTTTKGVATAVIGDTWTMQELSLPANMGFAPWTPTTSSRTAFSNSAKSLIAQVAASEISQNMHQQTYLNSMYFSGKALGKFAMIVYTLHDLLNEPDLAAEGLEQLKGEFALFVKNQQIAPLAYDSKWGGIVSSAGFTGDPNQDFGNTYYNDHHFHYGYFIHAAAIIAYLDPNWLKLNAAWVNTLIRDAGNPSTTDPHFPFSRMYDWFHGHSWAQGLFPSADGKDEESTSEDVHFAYALKMWGKVTGDASLEARGNLMLAILARSLRAYFHMESGNVNQPANFIANKATGILFENKIDHTTYFGTNPEYIEGIHMLPLTPATAYTRSAKFVSEEWNAYFSNSSFDPADQVAGGWRGILYGNLGTLGLQFGQPVWEFFRGSGFDPSWIDGGASRTWYLAYTAAIGGI